MKKKDYNQGMASGIKLSEDIVKNNTDAVGKMNDKFDNLNNDVKNIGNIFMNFVDEQEEDEVQRLLNIIKKISLNDLEEHDKLILANILSSVAMQYGANDEQRKFLKSFIKASGVSVEDALSNDFNGTALIDAIDSINKLQYMYQILNDYLYLEKQSTDFGDKYNDVFNWFGGIEKKADAKRITELKVKLYGKDILVEQFEKGFSYDEEGNDENNASEENSILPIDDKTPYKEISLPCAKKYFNLGRDWGIDTRYYLETKSYIIAFGPYFPHAYVKELRRIDKENHKITKLDKINKKFSDKDREKLYEDRKFCSVNDILIYIREDNVVLYDIKNDIETILPDLNIPNLDVTDIKHLAVNGDDLIYIKDGIRVGDMATYIYSLKERKEYRLENEYRNDVAFVVGNNKVYSISIAHESLKDYESRTYANLTIFDLKTKTFEDTSEINAKLHDIEIEHLSFDRIAIINNVLCFVGEVKWPKFKIVTICMDTGSVLNKKELEVPMHNCIKCPFIINNYILFANMHGHSWDLGCYDIAKDKFRVLHPDFYFKKIETSGLLFKKYEEKKEEKYYNMCGYWVTYRNGNYYDDDKNNWIFKDIREKWDTESKSDSINPFDAAFESENLDEKERMRKELQKRIDEMIKGSLTELRKEIDFESKKTILKTVVPVMGLFQLEDIQKLKEEIDIEIDKLISKDIRFTDLKPQRETMWKTAKFYALHLSSLTVNFIPSISPMIAQMILIKYFDLQADYIKKRL